MHPGSKTSFPSLKGGGGEQSGQNREMESTIYEAIPTFLKNAGMTAVRGFH